MDYSRVIQAWLPALQAWQRAAHAYAQAPQAWRLDDAGAPIPWTSLHGESPNAPSFGWLIQYDAVSQRRALQRLVSRRAELAYVQAYKARLGTDSAAVVRQQIGEQEIWCDEALQYALSAYSEIRGARQAQRKVFRHHWKFREEIHYEEQYEELQLLDMRWRQRPLEWQVTQARWGMKEFDRARAWDACARSATRLAWQGWGEVWQRAHETAYREIWEPHPPMPELLWEQVSTATALGAHALEEKFREWQIQQMQQMQQATALEAQEEEQAAIACAEVLASAEMALLQGRHAKEAFRELRQADDLADQEEQEEESRRLEAAHIEQAAEDARQAAEHSLQAWRARQVSEQMGWVEEARLADEESLAWSVGRASQIEQEEQAWQTRWREMRAQSDHALLQAQQAYGLAREAWQHAWEASKLALTRARLQAQQARSLWRRSSMHPPETWCAELGHLRVELAWQQATKETKLRWLHTWRLGRSARKKLRATQKAWARRPPTYMSEERWQATRTQRREQAIADEQFFHESCREQHLHLQRCDTALHQLDGEFGYAHETGQNVWNLWFEQSLAGQASTTEYEALERAYIEARHETAKQAAASMLELMQVWQAWQQAYEQYVIAIES